MTLEKTAERPATITGLFNQARENLKQRGVERPLPSQSNYLASAQENRELLDSIFIESRLLDPVTPDTSTALFGAKLKTPAFCSAVGRPDYLTDEDMVEVVRGMGKAGSLMMLGIGGSDLLQAAIDTGTPVVKMVKPYRNTDLIYQKVRDAEERGCLAVGMDIDHFYGVYRDGKADRTEIFAPKQTADIVQAISSTRLPFIIKGVLGVQDAVKAVQIGASAIVVSNHGWGAFDFGIPSIVALPRIAAAVGSRVTVLVDSGFRTGNDVFKALALGAKGVGLATSVLAAAGAGAEGVEQLIGFITDELKRTMAIAGCPSLAAIGQPLLVTSPRVAPWW